MQVATLDMTQMACNVLHDNPVASWHCKRRFSDMQYAFIACS